MITNACVHARPQVQFAQQRYCEIFATTNTSGCEDTPAANFNGSVFAFVRVPSAPTGDGTSTDSGGSVSGNTVELRMPDASPAMPQIVTGDVVLFASSRGGSKQDIVGNARNHDGTAASEVLALTRKKLSDRTVYGFAFAAQDTVIGILPPGSRVVLDGEVVFATATGSCLCSSSRSTSTAATTAIGTAASTRTTEPSTAARSSRTCNQTFIKYGVKYSHGDFHQIALPANASIADNAATCSRACCEDAECQAWTYAVADSAFGACSVGSGCCYLKNTTSRLSPRSDAASGTPDGGGGDGGGLCACAWLNSTDGTVLTRLSFDSNASRNIPTATSVQSAVTARLALLCGLTPPPHLPESRHWLFYKAVSTMKANVLAPGGNLDGTSEADGRLTWGWALFGWSQPMYAAGWRFAAPHLPIAETLVETFVNVVAKCGMEPHETTPTTVDVRVGLPFLLIPLLF